MVTIGEFSAAVYSDGDTIFSAVKDLKIAAAKQQQLLSSKMLSILATLHT